MPSPHRQNADDSDITQLFMQYHPLLVKKASSLVGEKFAEDIVQDAWVSLLQSSDTIRNHGPWLNRVIFNKSLNRLKKENRNISLDRSCIADPESHYYPEDSLISVADSPENNASLLQRLSKTQARWQSLPPKQKAACELRFVHEYSYEQIAEALNVSITNSKVLLHRGKALLVKTLKDT
jgi:RNA polymerase sigma-70 factor, ECF subfamily